MGLLTSGCPLRVFSKSSFLAKTVFPLRSSTVKAILVADIYFIFYNLLYNNFEIYNPFLDMMWFWGFGVKLLNLVSILE
jgi:hypothetical protein